MQRRKRKKASLQALDDVLELRGRISLGEQRVAPQMVGVVLRGLLGRIEALLNKLLVL